MNTITVRYWGGMGNVLFEISAAIAYSNKLNRPFILSKYPAFPNLDNYSASSIGLDEDEFATSLKEFSEEDITNNIPFPENQNIKLIGFYQRYLLFNEYKDQIFKILGMHSIRSAVNPIIHSDSFSAKGLFSNNTNEITISLHIRRGDYEQLPCYFLLLNEHYYKGALLHLVKMQKDVTKFKIICFYENKSHESANKVINSLIADQELAQYPLEYHHFNSILNESLTTVSDIQEMAIMSQCKHHIIANSTFSWWAAYINPDPIKMVCYPNEYFNHKLWYLSNDGLKVTGWTSIEAWNKHDPKCSCVWY
jgi:hypothetical protein